MALQYGWLPVGNEEVRFLEGGDGPPLVFLHGALSSMEIWKPAAEILSKQFYIFALDLPGFGSSKKNNTYYSIAFYADFLRDLLEKRKFSRPTVIGSSLGARVALEFALKYPTETDRVILQGPAGVYLPPWSLKSILANLFVHPIFLRFYLTRKRLKKIYSSALPSSNPHLKQVWESNPSFQDDEEYRLWLRAFSCAVRSLYRRGTGNQLVNVCRPTLVITGTKDKHHSAQEAKKISRDIPGAKLEIVQDAKHFLMLERPEEFAKIVADFVLQGSGAKSK